MCTMLQAVLSLVEKGDPATAVLRISAFFKSKLAQAFANGALPLPRPQP